MNKLFFLFLFLFSLNAAAQDKNADRLLLRLYSDTLKMCSTKLYSAKTDQDKKKYNQLLLNTFGRALNVDNSFDYPFDSLNFAEILQPPDKTFRIINWNVPYEDGTQEYFGFIQEKFTVVKKGGLFKTEKKETMLLFPLIDKSAENNNPENSISDNTKWYGMLYSKIIVKKTKNKTYYTLLAWDGNDKFTKKKIIDVLTFDKKGIPHFGAAIFNMQKKFPKRVIFECAASCSMSLRYNSKKDSIVFDHLAPDQPGLEGQFQYYCTDMSYDGFGFKHGKWNYGVDLNAVNDKDANDKYYNDPHKANAAGRESKTIIPAAKKKKKKKK